MKSISLLLIFCLLTVEGFAQGTFVPGNVPAFQIYVVDANDSDCEFVYPHVGSSGAIPLGLNSRSQLMIRIEQTMVAWKEKVRYIVGSLVSDNLEVLHIGRAEKIQKSEGGKWALAFILDRNVSRKLLSEKAWQYQITVQTDKNKYVYSRAMQFYDSRDEILAYYPQDQCYYTTPAIIASALYRNDSSQNSMNIEFEPEITRDDESGKDRFAGFVELGYNSGSFTSSSAVTRNSFHTQIGGSFYSSREWSLRQDHQKETSQAFTLSPLASGFIVRQDIVKMTKAQTLRFDQCGLLSGEANEVRWKTEPLPAYTFLPIPSDRTSDFEYIDKRLKSFKTVNTCPRGRK